MDVWIDLARGPLFRIAVAVLVLGLAYRSGVLIAHIVRAWRRAGDPQLPIAEVAAATLRWIVPVRLLAARPLYSAASFLFHLGILIVPLFLAGHVALLAGLLPAGWPVLPAAVADALTLVAVVALAGLLLGRVATRSSRALGRTQDWTILVLLLGLVVTGLLVAHPLFAPFDARSLLLAHILIGDLALALTPVTKIAHCVLYPFTQIVFRLGWHFPAESGRHVAIALGKENEPV